MFSKLVASWLLVPGFAYLARKQQQVDGDIKLPGLQQAGAIRRDGHGVLHIEADNVHDCIYLQGFCII